MRRDLLFQFRGGQPEHPAGDDELLDLLGALEDVEDLDQAIRLPAVSP